MDDELFLACFDADLPGVVMATWQAGSEVMSARMHFFIQPEIDLGELRTSQLRYSAIVPAAWIATLGQGTRLTIDAETYVVAAPPLGDGHGYATLLLERARL